MRNKVVVKYLFIKLELILTMYNQGVILEQSKLRRFLVIADTDWFASHLNKQLSNYLSWHPNPESVGINAFNLP